MVVDRLIDSGVGFEDRDNSKRRDGGRELAAQIYLYCGATLGYRWAEVCWGLGTGVVKANGRGRPGVGLLMQRQEMMMINDESRECEKRERSSATIHVCLCKKQVRKLAAAASQSPAIQRSRVSRIHHPFSYGSRRSSLPSHLLFSLSTCFNKLPVRRTYQVNPPWLPSSPLRRRRIEQEAYSSNGWARTRIRLASYRTNTRGQDWATRPHTRRSTLSSG